MKSARWQVLFVRYRFERLVIRQLRQQNIECFWPVLRSKNGTKTIEMPLFPRYVFCKAPSRALPLSLLPGVLWVVDAEPGDIQEDVQTLKRVTESGLPCKPGRYSDVGTAAIAQDGPLRGLHGFVKNETHLIIPIRSLLRSVIVETDRTCSLVCADSCGQSSPEPDAA